MLESYKLKQKISYDKTSFLKNETGHKLNYKYTGLYKVTEIGERNNNIITNTKNKKQTVHKDRLKTFFFITAFSMAML